MAKVFNIGGNTISYGGFLLRELGSGSLTISKTVSGSGFDPTKTFELMVVFSVPITYNGTTSTTHTFNLAHGQSVTITGIPELTEYEVTETPLSELDVVMGYSIEGMTNPTGSIGNDSAVVCAAANSYGGGLPPGSTSFRFYFEDPSYNPTTSGETWSQFGVWTQVSSSPNIWDYTKTSNLVMLREEFAGKLSTPCHLISIGDYFANVGGQSSLQVQMKGMLQNCTGLKSSVPFTIDFSPTNSAEYLFAGCTALESAPLIRKSGPGAYPPNLSHAFEGCTSLTDISNLDMIEGTTQTYEYEFAGCTALETADNVGNAGIHTFDGCISLRSVGMDWEQLIFTEASFKDCSSLTTMPSSLYAVGASSPYNRIRYAFKNCFSLETVGAITSRNIKLQTDEMFYGCSSLRTIPTFASTINFEDSVANMFNGCVSVESGALDFYNRMSSQSTPPTYHNGCFTNCGSNTTTGAAELAQIPSSWGGTGT